MLPGTMLLRASRVAGLRAVVLAAAVLAVAGQADAQRRVPRILNGTPTAEFASVGIVGDRTRAFCSGTLISPRHVLTAAHCAMEVSSPTGGTFQVGGETYTTSAIHIHPDYDPEAVPPNDIAIFELSEPVVGVDPASIFLPPEDPEAENPLRVGATLTIVGFGGGGNFQDGDDGTFGTKRVGTTPIDGLDDYEIIWFFDNENESNTGFGDSGGPGFLLIDGEYFIASITSSGTDPNAAMGDVAFNTRVDAFAVWIAETVADASEPPPPADEPPPLEEEPIPPIEEEPIPPVEDEFDGMFCPAGGRPDFRPPGHGPWGRRPGSRRPGLGILGWLLGRFEFQPSRHGPPGRRGNHFGGLRRP